MGQKKGYLTSLHLAACEGQVIKANRIICKKSFLLNKKDRYGMTPLHYAVMHSKFATAKLLIRKGAQMNALDCEGYPPIFYAKNRLMKRLLRSHGAKAYPFPSVLHQAALKGDLSAIKSNLRLGLNIVDSKYRTPLHYAVMKCKIRVIGYLLKMGANPYEVDANQRNIVDLAKRKNRHTFLSRFLKKKIGLSKERLLASIQPLLVVFKERLAVAKLQKKKLMILLGETHGDYRLYQIEKILLAHLSNMGIKHLFVETKKEASVISDEYEPMINKRSHQMTIHGVDNHPRRETASLKERNAVIARELTTLHKHGVMITGMRHLYGLAKDKQTRLSQQQFKVVVVNLSAGIEGQMSNSIEDKYAHQDDKVIQLKLR